MIQRWDVRGAAAATRLEAVRDIAYGDGILETLDIYRPPAPAGKPAPVLFFIHGGYWQWRDKKDFVFLAEPWVASGVVTVIVNYPLAPAAGMDEIVDACRRAVAWTAGRIARHGGDPHDIWLAGHSAGGHLTAEMLATDWRRFGYAMPPIAGGLAISGLYELEPIRRTYLNDVLGMDAETARRNSPLLHPPGECPPLICAVGGDETAEFHRQQAALVEAWSRAGRTVETMPLPGRNHFTVLDAFADPGHPLFVGLRQRMGS
ncbi:alpha/beta hydrolase [Allostella humosa]|uniref:alpha/beta hydrolase n=1 Tax=Stella humosa TaxID=94 RepID=UPI001476FBED|nr:alpha/beta hydrolase [Stella humosa]